MASKHKAVARMSAALTLITAGGLVAATLASLPQGRALLERGAAMPASAAASAAGLEERAPLVAVAGDQAAAPAGEAEMVRARAVPASEPGIGGVEAAGPPPAIVLAASRRKTPEPAEGEVPSSTWDGTPQSGTHAAPEESPPADEKPAAPTAKIKPQDPRPGPPKKDAPPAPAAEPAAAPAAAPPPPDVWSPEEVAAALKDCLKLLGPVAAEIEPIDPMKKGSCGAAAPIRLKSVGARERMEFTPPIEINCRLAVGLADWVERSLQPAAKSELGSRVVRVTGAAGYQCRNRYGLPNAPLSEHALANAVDVPGFVLADGRTIRIKSAWGPTARDLLPKPEIATAGPADTKQAPVDKTAAKPEEKKPDERKDAKSRKDGAAGKEPATGVKAGTRAALKGIGVQKPGAGATPVAAKGVALDPGKLAPEARFLRESFKGACQVFGTVLGPEANEAHRDHFHLDMKARKKSAYCE
jgi:hypothetical protein